MTRRQPLRRFLRDFEMIYLPVITLLAIAYAACVWVRAVST